jgi:tRNA (guanine-N(7)-)-methyltransferase
VKKINYTKYPLPRIRHHAKSGLYFPLKQQKGNRFYYHPEIKNIDWKQTFRDGKPPALLDIGCGIGKFLVEMSIAEPDKNILGFEVRKGAVEWTEGVIAGEELPNARAFWFSVVNGFPFIETGTLEKVFYFFPDPWLKKKHYKRRAFSLTLLKEIHRVLKPDGRLYLMTDVPEVDEFQQEVIKESGLFKFKYSGESEWDISVRSNHESFCIEKDIPFIRMVCEKM